MFALVSSPLLPSPLPALIFLLVYEGNSFVGEKKSLQFSTWHIDRPAAWQKDQQFYHYRKCVFAHSTT